MPQGWGNCHFYFSIKKYLEKRESNPQSYHSNKIDSSFFFLHVFYIIMFKITKIYIFMF